MHQAAQSSVANGSKIAISGEIASNGVDCVVITSATTGTPEFLLVEAVKLDVVPLCTVRTYDMGVDHGFLRYVCGLAVEGIIFIDAMLSFAAYAERRL